MTALSDITAATSHDAHYENPLYDTNDAAEELVPILSSTDLVDWTYEGGAFTSRPGWKYGSIWAPVAFR